MPRRERTVGTSMNRIASQTTEEWLRDYDPDKLYAHPGGVFEPKPYMRSALGLFEYIRDRFGYGLEILHDDERFRSILDRCGLMKRES